MVKLLRQLFSIEEDFVYNPVRQKIGLELLLSSAHTTLLVAEMDGEVVGMVSGQVLISTAEGSPALLVEDLVVDEGMRGKGIGKALLTRVGAWGKQKNAERMQLLADCNNLKAIDFYQQSGWRKTSLICLRSYHRSEEHVPDTD